MTVLLRTTKIKKITQKVGFHFYQIIKLEFLNHSLILESIRKHIPLQKEDELFLTSLLHEKKLRKKEILHHSGEIHTNSAFVLDGCLRSYSLDTNGFEHIVQFAPRGWWIADLSSLLSGKPGKMTIDAVEDSTVLLLKRTDQEKLFQHSPVFERYFRIIIENSVVAQHNRLLDYLSLTAQQRFQDFCQRYPTLVKTLPQKQIASYIGVTPEFLSKMKAGLLRQKT